METPPPRPPAPAPTTQTPSKWDSRAAKDRRLFSDLWCMSAATFRRFGKIEQARGAIQEAEVRDGNNPTVWVQVSNLLIEISPSSLKLFQQSSDSTTMHWVTNRRLYKRFTRLSLSNQSMSLR